MNIDHYREQFDYNHWANKAVMAALEAAEVVPGQALTLFSHMFAAERIWRTRLQDMDSSHILVWPKNSLADCNKAISRNHSEWQNWLDGLESEALNTVITYHNSKGKLFENKAADILTHVIIHGAYHRAQIALLLRQHGEEPPVTDFIFYQRRMEL